MNLSQTTKDVLVKIEQAEAEKRYNDHLDSILTPEYYEVDKNYRFDKPWYIRLGYFFLMLFIVRPYCFIVNHFWLKVKVTGKKNLAKIKGPAIVTCNHVNKLDAIALGKALKGHKCHYTVAEFNNMKSRLGAYMRAYGIMPFSNTNEGMKNFNHHLEKYLSKGHFITFFPERSEWWCYEKPRPLQIGAFHYAAKYNVPVLPVFITFIKTGKYDNQGIEKRKFIVNILEPIYPNNDLTLKDCKEQMKSLNEERNKECYENFYHKKLEL